MTKQVKTFTCPNCLGNLRLAGGNGPACTKETLERIQRNLAR